MSRCCATTARSPASATPWPRACWTRSRQGFIGVDAPDFNLGLEERLRAGILRCTSSARRSGPGAAAASRSWHRSCDHVLCLFPFEPELLQQHGVAATYVGHPLADAIPLQAPRAARAALGVD
jgi:lipid-A-disaccharide synthase